MSNKMSIFTDHVSNHFNKWIVRKTDVFMKRALERAASVGELSLVADLIRKELDQVEATILLVTGGKHVQQ